MTKYLNLLLFLWLAASNSINPYDLIQTFEEPDSQILSMEISFDNQILVAGCMDAKTYIYKNNGTRFNFDYSLEESQDGVWEIDLTRDKQWLLTIDTSFYADT